MNDLREIEFGILDRLTRQGIEQYHPEQAIIRRSVGKVYASADASADANEGSRCAGRPALRARDRATRPA
jgi:hypothetical protein